MSRVKCLVVALAGLIFGAAIACNADFIDRFSNNRVGDSDTIHHFWNQSTYSGPIEKGSSILKTTGKLQLSYSGDFGVTAGPRLFTGKRSVFNFFSHPVSVTITAVPNSTLTPVKGGPAKDGDLVDGAWTYVGFTGAPGPQLATGANRILLQLSSRNLLKFSIIDADNKLVYTIGLWNLPTNARVTKMTLYVDGTDEAHDNFFINFGVQYAATNGTIVNYMRFLTPFNLGFGNGKEGNRTQRALDRIKAGYSGVGAALQIQLLNVGSK